MGDNNITHPIIIDYLLSKQLQIGKNPIGFESSSLDSAFTK